MTRNIVLDLGEDGEIVIVGPPDDTWLEDDIIEESGLDEVGDYVRVKLEEASAVLKARLRGLGRLFASAIPTLDDENFTLDEFSTQFELSLEAEIGVVAKVVPGGSFACTYTWKRKPPAHS